MSPGWSETTDQEERGSLTRLLLSPATLMLLIGVVGAVSFGAVALLLADDEPALPAGYFGDVARLSAEAGADLEALAPASVLAGCLAGDAASCAEQESNAAAAAERVAAFADAIGASTPPFRAVVWHSAYLDALADLRASLLAQAEALAARDPAAFDAAVARTRAAVRNEESLTEQFNQDFADDLG